MFKPVNNLFCCKTGLNVGGKTRNIVIQFVLQQCCKTSCRFFVVRFSVPTAHVGLHKQTRPDKVWSKYVIVLCHNHSYFMKTKSFVAYSVSFNPYRKTS